MHFSDGEVYEGSWYLGHAHGFGKRTHVKGDTYEGDWVDNMRHGIGEMRFKNGVRYHGTWFKNGREGVGVEILTEKAVKVRTENGVELMKDK